MTVGPSIGARAAASVPRRVAGALVVAAGLGWALPAAAEPWSDYLKTLEPTRTPADVIGYLKRHPLVQGAPEPRFHQIRTETIDGSVKQDFKLAGYQDGLGHIEGVRNAQTVEMTTALGGLVLVDFHSKAIGATVFLRKIALDGELLPPATDRKLSMRYERVQVTPEQVVEEIRDCALTWSKPGGEQPELGSHCTGSTRVLKRAADGSVTVQSAPEDSRATFVYRSDLGWLFNQNTRVLEFKP